jgi:hypothetical protein
VDELRAALAPGVHQRGRVEVRRNRDDGVGDAGVQRALVSRPGDRDGAQSEPATRGEDADGDLAAVGDQQRSPVTTHRRRSLPPELM